MSSMTGARGQRRQRVALLLAALLTLWLAGCASQAPAGDAPAVEASNPHVSSSPTPIVASRPLATAASTATPAPPRPTATATPAPSATPSPTSQPYVVVVDPGHGGIDLGARRFDDQGRMVYHESQVTLELGLLVRDELKRRGLQVVMTREGDYEVNAEGLDVSGDGVVDYTVDESQARVDLANAANADVLLSLHLNAFEYPDGRRAPDVGGAQTFYCGHRPFVAENIRLAELVHGAVLAAVNDLGYSIQDRGVQDDAHLITPDSPGEHIILLGPESARIARPSQMPGVLSEPLFITHDVEGEMARDPVVLARLAVAYADAVEAFLRGDEPGR